MTVQTTYGKITASKDMLNVISSAFYYEAEHYRTKNKDTDKYQGEREQRVCDEIYDALREAGFYNN